MDKIRAAWGPKATLVDALRDRAEAHPQRTFARFLEAGDLDRETTTWSYGELSRRARAIAAQLQATTQPGDRALLMFPQGLDYIAAFFGCLSAGVIAVPAYPPDPTRLGQTVPRLQGIVRDATPKVALTLSRIQGLAQGLTMMAPEIGQLRWMGVDALDLAAADDWRPGDVGPEDLAFLQYTSGSTSAPKGVMISHANLMANQRQICAAFGHDAIIAERGSLVGVSWLPMFHDMGLIGNVIQPLWLGGTMTYLSPLDFLKRPARWLEAVSASGAATSGGPDFAYALCARRVSDAELEGLDLSRWRVAYSGAERVRPRTLEAFARRFAPAGFAAEAFYPTYGLAEATLIASGGRPGEGAAVAEVDAAALSRREVRGGAQAVVGCGAAVVEGAVAIVNPETRRPTEGVGEIWLRGPHVARGYWGRPELSEATFAATLAEGGPPHLRTGDLGFLRDGSLYIAGRAKDLVIVRGRNLYPEDIEATVEGVDPAIRGGCSAAFGVEIDGEERLVIIAEARGAEGAQRLVERIRAAVAAAHEVQPWAITLIPPRALPKTSSGKRQRWAARRAWEADKLEALHAWRMTAVEVEAEAGDALLGWMIAWMRAHLDLPGGVDPDATFSAQGIDSVMGAEMAAALEAHLARDVPAELFFGNTVRRVAELLSEATLGAEALGGALTPAALREAAALPEALRPAPAALDERWPTTLVTGATGFLGAYLLAELLERTPDDLLCLVRAEDPEAAAGRVRRNLKRYGLWRPDYPRRLRMLPGDLAAPRLGLSEARFAQIAGQLTAIHHCGARVDWARPFAELAPANVDGTREIVRLACLGGGVPVHFVSSVGVFPVGSSPRSWFPEAAPLTEGESLRIGYFQTKYVAEKLLEEARGRGVPVTIYRPGFITGDAATGAEPDSHGQLMGAFLAGCLRLGQAPRFQKVMDVVPVDYVARAIVALALSPEAGSPAYTLINPQPMRQDHYYARLRAYGWPLEAIPYGRWREALMSLPADSGNPLVRFKGYYRTMSEHRMNRLESLLSRRMPTEDTAAHAHLEALGVRCPPFDEALLHTYLSGYVARGVIPAPPGHAEGAPLERPARVEGGAPAAAEATTLLEGRHAIAFTADYEGVDPKLTRLYARGKQRQWDAAHRIDWSLDLDPHNPQELPDEAFPLFGSDVWARQTERERAALRHHYQAWQISQFLHGEQGALLCASKLVQQVPRIDTKLYAATQVMDEARHVEAFSRLLEDKLELSYPVSRPLERLLGDVIGDARWDMTFLGMQVLIEGLALAAFSTIRDQSKNPLAVQVNAYVMEDEARHVAFGRLALADYYPHLTDAERDVREEFVVEASYLLRDRFFAEDVWARLGLPVDACLRYMNESGYFHRFRAELFRRIVPTIKAIGLWGPRVRRAYERLGVIGFADVDLEAMLDEDQRVAAELDAKLGRGPEERP